MLGMKILGYPVRIVSNSYARNAFHFNVCFVFASTTRTVAFEPVVRKLTEYLIDLELSSKLLSHVADGDLFSCLQNLLTRVRNDINSNGVCLLQGKCYHTKLLY